MTHFNRSVRAKIRIAYAHSGNKPSRTVCMRIVTDQQALDLREIFNGIKKTSEPREECSRGLCYPDKQLRTPFLILVQITS